MIDFRAFLCIMEKLIFKHFTDEEVSKSFEMYRHNNIKGIQYEDLKQVVVELNEDIYEEDLKVWNYNLVLKHF